MSKENEKHKFTEIVKTIAVWLSTAFGSFVVLSGCLVILLWSYQTSLPELSMIAKTAKGIYLALSVCLVIGVSTFLSVYIFANHPAALAPTILCPIAYVGEPIFLLLLGPGVIGAIAGYYLNRYTYHQQRQAFRAGVDRNLWDLNLARIALYAVMAILLATLIPFEKYQPHWWSIALHSFVAEMAFYSLPSWWGIWSRTEALFATFENNSECVGIT